MNAFRVSFFHYGITAVSLLGCNNPSKSPGLSFEDSVALKNKADSTLLAKEAARLKSESDSLAAELDKLWRKWDANTFADQFGDPTNERFVVNLSMGTFSNSATSNSPLWVEVIFKKSAAGIFLHEYSLDRPAEKLGVVVMMLKNEAGQQQRIVTSGDWGQSGGILIDDGRFGDFAKFKNFLVKSSGKVKAVITDKYSSTYLFTIDTTELSESLKSI